MRTTSLRQLASVAALAVATVATAACSSAPVQALPGQPTPAPSSEAPSVPTASRPAPDGPSPGPAVAARPRNAGAAHGPRCLGAVIYRLDAAQPKRARPLLCIAVGGVLRVENLGPEGFSTSPADKISCWYEGGVRECRLIRTGTVRITINNARETRTLSLVITRASRTSGPEPACLNARTTHVVDAAEGGPPWAALCMKVGAVVRFENHGPEGFSVDPRAAVSCFYAAGVRECRLVSAATVTFSVVNPEETRTLTVVARA